nr:(4Fe-4S)-binding protein [Corynebacterium lactis]
MGNGSVDSQPEGYKAYEADGVVIYWKADLCQHSRNCVRGNPNVFEYERRPWIDPTAASPEEIATVIDRCPSGALKYRLK